MKNIIFVSVSLLLSLSSSSQTYNCKYDYNFKDDLTQEIRASLSNKIVNKDQDIVIQFERKDSSIVMTFHCISGKYSLRLYNSTNKEPLFLVFNNDSIEKLYPNSSMVYSKANSGLTFSGVRNIEFAPAYNMTNEILLKLQRNMIKKIRITAKGTEGMRQNPIENIEYEIEQSKALLIPPMIDCILNVDITHQKLLSKKK